jgi:hypothetical protein
MITPWFKLIFCRYISRANPRDNTRHVILSTASLRPTDFAVQLNVVLANGWGIVRTVTDMCMKMPEGKYVLVKDPNKVRDTCKPTFLQLNLRRCSFAASYSFVFRPNVNIYG